MGNVFIVVGLCFAIILGLAGVIEESTNNYYINNYTINGTAGGLFSGKQPYLYNNTEYIFFNESKVNATIDARKAAGNYQSSAAGWSNTSTTTSTSKLVRINSNTANSFVLGNASGTAAINLTYSGLYGGKPWGTLVFNDYAGGSSIYSKAGYITISQKHSTYGFMMIRSANVSQYGGEGVLAGGDYRVSSGVKDLVFLTDNFGDEHMRLIDDGATTIYSINTTNKALIIKNKAGQSSSLTEWQNASGTTFITITAAGRIGIGTTTPSYPLHINKNVSGIGLRVEGNISAKGLIFTSYYPEESGAEIINQFSSFQSDNKGGLNYNLLDVKYKAVYQEPTYNKLYTQKVKNRDCEVEAWNAGIKEYDIYQSFAVENPAYKTFIDNCKKQPLEYETIETSVLTGYKTINGINAEKVIMDSAEAIKELNNQIQFLKTELCNKDRTYNFCVQI